MLELDVAVTSALLLSLASAILCVVYGWSRWNADDDASPSDGSSSVTEGATSPALRGPES